jgi:hypothetical protein
LIKEFNDELKGFCSCAASAAYRGAVHAAEMRNEALFRFHSESGYSRSSTLYSRGDDKLLPKVGKLQRAGTPKKLDRLGVLRSQVERETAPIVR